MRFVVHLPTRSRPDRALFVVRELERLRSKVRPPNEVLYNLVVDRDDVTMQGEVATQLVQLGCKLNVIEPSTKIAAVNACVPDPKTWDVIILASDDMTPLLQDWDEDVRVRMEQHFPDLGGALWYFDGRVVGMLSTYNIMGRTLYRRMGYLYNPEYKSFCSDNEYTELLMEINRIPRLNCMLFRHDHCCFGPALKGLENDALYKRNDQFVLDDRRVMRHRAARGWGFPGVKLSILILSVTRRRAMLKALLAELEHQICDPGPNGELPLNWAVEVCVDSDDGQTAIGTKRNHLLERAVGDYVCFVDDDDWIGPNYCREILAAIEQRPDVVGLFCELTMDGGTPYDFELSIKYLKWGDTRHAPIRRGQWSVCYFCPPTHLCPVRRDLALQIQFPTSNRGEDINYSYRLHPLLKKEVIPESKLYYYRFIHTKPRAMGTPKGAPKPVTRQPMEPESESVMKEKPAKKGKPAVRMVETRREPISKDVKTRPTPEAMLWQAPKSVAEETPPKPETVPAPIPPTPPPSAFGAPLMPAVQTEDPIASARHREHPRALATRLAKANKVTWRGAAPEKK